MLKLVIFGALAIGAAAISFLKRHQARAHLTKLEAGGCCLSCDSPDVVREEAGVRCQTCGYLTSNEMLDGPGVSEAELRALNQVDGPKRR